MNTNPADYPFWFRVVVVITLAVLSVNLVFFSGPLSALVTASITLMPAHELLAAVGTLAATFFGAWFAFRFEKSQRRREREDNEVAAGNRTLLILSEMWNAMTQQQKEVIDPYRGRTDAWLNLGVAPPLDQGLSFDVSEITFLLQSAAPTFQEVLLEARRYRLGLPD